MVRSIAVDDKALEGSGDYQPIPDGTRLRVSLYDIEETVVANGENKGKPQAMYTVKVTEDGEFKGREVRYNYVPLYAGAKNGWVLTAFAEAMGWPIDKESKIVSIPDNLRDALGTQFIAKFGTTESTKVNPETGKPYVNNRVTGTRRIKGAGGITDPAAQQKAWKDL
ncbi:MAG: hypothetical protein E6R03_17495 [Hyphomicrobiaceae bacterium]|nr:MAG: hypothetical protein E6R03_17495 [Hyphomicrobiaceae bacterium]